MTQFLVSMLVFLVGVAAGYIGRPRLDQWLKLRADRQRRERP